MAPWLARPFGLWLELNGLLSHPSASPGRPHQAARHPLLPSAPPAELAVARLLVPSSHHCPPHTPRQRPRVLAAGPGAPASPGAATAQQGPVAPLTLCSLGSLLSSGGLLFGLSNPHCSHTASRKSFISPHHYPVRPVPPSAPFYDEDAGAQRDEATCPDCTAYKRQSWDSNCGHVGGSGPGLNSTQGNACPQEGGLTWSPQNTARGVAPWSSLHRPRLTEPRPHKRSRGEQGSG